MRMLLLRLSLLASSALAACSSSTTSSAPAGAAAAGAGGDAAGQGGSGGAAGYIGSIGGQMTRPTPSPGVNGVYVISPALTTGGPTLADGVYALPTFDGVVLRLRWDAFEPKSGSFDFYELDTEVERAIFAGKKVAVALLAGAATPDWVYGPMAEELAFVIAGGDASGADCQSVHAPAPWAPGFQTAFTGAIAQLGLHLSQQPGVLDAVRLVVATGINATAEDLELPHASGALTPLGCQLSDTDSVWQAAGYRPSKLQSAWAGLLTAYAQAFPTTTILAPTVGAGFPGVDETGARVDPTTVDPTSSLLDAGTSMLGGRFAVQGADLTADSTDPRVAAARAAGAIVGFRPNDFLGKNGAGCGSDDPATATACTDAQYGGILHHGVDLGASFLSVRVVEVTAFPGSIEDAQSALHMP